MRVGYGKICRVVEMEPEKWGGSGGDNEPPALLLTLARRHPDVEWVVTARNSGWTPPLPNIVNPWVDWLVELRQYSKRWFRLGHQSRETLNWTVGMYDELTMSTLSNVDGYVMWMGQHGTSNSPIPTKKNPSVYTRPQISAVHYGGYQVRAMNVWRHANPLEREEIWLIADPRNHIKARDLMWPRRHPVLTQFNFERSDYVARYGVPGSPEDWGFASCATESQPDVWRVTDRYLASGLELVGIPSKLGDAEPSGWDDRDQDFGLLINEARAYGVRSKVTRLQAMQEYVNPIGPSWVHGSWTTNSLAELGTEIKPIPYHQIFPLMQRTKTTFTTPSSGSEWATAKPWESFATGLVCFFHPLYDTQDHILFPDGPEAATDELRHLHAWLRVTDPEDLARKVKAVSSSRETWEWLVDVQYRHFRRELARQRAVTTIERRLGLA